MGVHPGGVGGEAVNLRLIAFKSVNYAKVSTLLAKVHENTPLQPNEQVG